MNSAPRYWRTGREYLNPLVNGFRPVPKTIPLSEHKPILTTPPPTDKEQLSMPTKSQDVTVYQSIGD